ncbi:MAG: glycosyltransferase family 39 protein [Planctomycetia bacterium]|nr:glycosyltransferase family 39 protein [Planctomycetia bacterium]
MTPSLNPVVSLIPAPNAQSPATGKLTDRACKRIATGLIVGSVVLHLAYLGFGCPLDLSPDEAHYWQWSRHLAWSYYSKGPLVAWLIRASCEVFGPLSESLTGSLMLAVRLPAVACHAALLAGWYILAARTLRSHRAALGTLALAMTLPAVLASAVLMTIDPPFLACWCWAAVGVWKGLTGGSIRWWLLAGICSAFGVLAKYPMVLLPAGVFGYLLFAQRSELKRAGFWVFALGSIVGFVPILLWNASHDWVSFKHVGTQAAGSSGSSIRWLGPMTFAAGQFAFLIGVWFVVWVAAAWANRRSADPARAFLWWTSVPVWCVFALASFKASGQVNWPAAAYVSGFVLGVAWVRDQLSGRHRKHVARLVSFGAALGLALSVLMHYPTLMRSALVSAAGLPTEVNPAPIRKYDPTARLRGWRTLAHEVDVIRDRVRAQTGEEPLVAATVWNVPGALGVYCKGHPETYSFGLAMADRHSQYDLWHPNPVADPQVFRGRTFVFVGDGLPADSDVFERVEVPTIVVHREEGVPVAVWWVWVGHGFRGFPDTPLYRHSPRY